jgi:protein-arginine deiminase
MMRSKAFGTLLIALWVPLGGACSSGRSAPPPVPAVPDPSGAGEQPVPTDTSAAEPVVTGGSPEGMNANTPLDGTGGSGDSTNDVALTLLTDTNRDGAIDDSDTANLTDWSWKGSGAFFIANVDDDDEQGGADASDQIVNGAEDEQDLARIVVESSAHAAGSASGIRVAVTAGAAQSHVFAKNSAGWTLVDGPLSPSQRIELGIEATQFADAESDGFATVKVDLLGPGGTSISSQEVKVRVAPWLMLPQSAETEQLYISSTTSDLRPDLDEVLEGVGLPRALASNPGQQDVWFQDTMEIGYTQLPGMPPMHVVLRAQRPNASDDVAVTLLGPDFGFISIGTPREPAADEDYWMDWTGNLEVTHAVPGYPLGRIYYGRSDRTTFHPTIVKFLEAQEVQKPFTVYTNWLVIQHVDEVLNFLTDQNGKAKMIIASPAAANTVLGSGYDGANQQIQRYIDEEIAQAKTELGLTDDDIIQLPTFFDGNGTDYAPRWSSPVNSVLAGRKFMIGETDVPDAIKTDIEQKLSAIGIEAAWVDDREYHVGGGNVHCGTNTKKTPICTNFTKCIP